MIIKLNVFCSDPSQQEQLIGSDAISNVYPQIDNDGTTIIKLLDGTTLRVSESVDDIYELINPGDGFFHISELSTANATEYWCGGCHKFTEEYWCGGCYKFTDHRTSEHIA